MAFIPASDIFEYRSRDVVNEKYCRILSKLTFSQFKKFYDNPEDEQTESSCQDMKTQYSLLISYCNEQIKQNFHLKTRYKCLSGCEMQIYTNVINLLNLQ